MRVAVSLSLALLTLAHSAPAWAEVATPTPALSKHVEECKVAIDAELTKEHRFFRTVLFGQVKPQKAPIATVFYDNLGNSWYKWRQNEWRSLAVGFENTTWSDTLMEEQHEFAEEGIVEERKGIFQTRRVLTSALIPYILQSTQALQCRLDFVCARARSSVLLKQQNPDTPKDIKVAVDGCTGYKDWQDWLDTTEEPTWKSIPACHLAESNEVFDEASVRGYCTNASEQIMAREIETLKVLVEYDAAYRSLLQFSGMFDQFLLSWRWTVTGSIRQATSLIGSLSRIPCFIGSCDASPPPLTP